MTGKVRLEQPLPWPASAHGNRVCLQHHAYVLFYFPQMPWMPRMHCAKHLLMNLLAGWCFCSGPGSLEVTGFLSLLIIFPFLLER